MILSAIPEKLKRRSKGDFKGRHFEASLILQAATAMILSVGGFLGIGGFLGKGDKLVAALVNQIRIGSEAKFTTDLTKDQLTAAPAFDFSKLK